MLIHLSIKNFAVVKQLDLNVEQGLTAITGETGAGKSIAIDAISLCLGGRADAQSVRKGATKAEITAHFSLKTNIKAKQWLDENELTAEDDADSCFIRRVISSEGRSKAFINGVAASLNQLREFGALLLTLCGQNTHLKLLKESEQLQLLDQFADHNSLILEVAKLHQTMRNSVQQLDALKEAQQTHKDRQQLLAYQVKELNEFALQEHEFATLEAEHKRLSHSQTLLSQTHESLYALYDSEEYTVLGLLRQHTDKLSALVEHDPQLAGSVQLLEESTIQIEEAVQDLRHYADQLDSDPEQLAYIEQRFSQAVELARKHHVKPEELCEHHLALATELEDISSSESRLESLEKQVEASKQAYRDAARALSEARKASALDLAKELMRYIKQMNMPNAALRIDVDYDASATPSKYGLDKVNIMACTNAGTPFGKLEKVVSGGELSRIGLAVQVVSRSKTPIPTMIFDEVDTGISGPTASIVGKLLRQLGKQQQVMCVTHLPQVAAQAHNQLFVSKLSNKDETVTRVIPLTPQDRVDELARLLAGDKITESAIANAKELLAQADT